MQSLYVFIGDKLRSNSLENLNKTEIVIATKYLRNPSTFYIAPRFRKKSRQQSDLANNSFSSSVSTYVLISCSRLICPSDEPQNKSMRYLRNVGTIVGAYPWLK